MFAIINEENKITNLLFIPTLHTFKKGLHRNFYILWRPFVQLLFTKLFHRFNNYLSLCLNNLRRIKEYIFFKRFIFLINESLFQGISPEIMFTVFIRIFLIDIKCQMDVISCRISCASNNSQLLPGANKLSLFQMFR